jgi:hypothetical protein
MVPKWRSFKEGGSARGAVSIGSLVYSARLRGADIPTGVKFPDLKLPREEIVSPPPEAPTEYKTISELYAMDIRRDPTCLLGDRFLCESGSMLMVGQSGIGKSSLTAQGTVLWGLGLDLFGLTPAKPLKSVVIQAENDDGDLAEEVQGVVDGLHLSHRLDELDKQVIILRETARTAADFVALVRVVVETYKPNLVWIDPLLAFLGGDVSDQQTVSKFLRNGINPIALEHRCAFIAVHHTGKPPKESGRQKTSGELAYLGIGSSDMTNWARAILVLREVEDDLYELRAVKRGKRSGLLETKISQTRGSKAFIQHGQEGIFWRYSDQVPGQEELDAQAEAVNEIGFEIGSGGKRYKDIIDIISKVLKTKARTTCTNFFSRTLKHSLKKSESTGIYVFVRPQSKTVQKQSKMDSLSNSPTDI